VGEAAQNYTGRYSQAEEIPWARSACSREEKQVQDIETIAALWVNVRVKLCVW